MSLLDSFRPRWKHNDSEVRTEAVRELEDLAALLEVARQDSDPAIRRIAIRKLDDPRVLAELGSSESDESVKELANSRARELRLAAATGRDEAKAASALADLSAEWDLGEIARRAAIEAVREAALARIIDVKVIADVARRGEDASARSAALARITDPALLIEVALTEPDKEVSEMVVARIGDRAALEEIERRGKSKRARALASLKLSQLRAAAGPGEGSAPEIPPEKIREARLAQVCRRAEAAESEDELGAAQAAWVDLGPGSSDSDREYAARFEAAVAAYAARAAAQSKAASERSDAEAARATAARQETDKALAAAEGDGATREMIEARRKEADDKLAAAREQLKKRLDETAVNLEELAATDSLKVAERAIKRADELVDKAHELPADQRATALEKLRAARDKVKVRALELREAEEWKRWANVPRLEELCIKIEGLIEATDLKQAAHDLRSAQAEWKTLPAPKDKSEPLWHRFKHAADQVYARCKAHFHEMDEQRAGNLKKKEELCEQVEALKDSTEWNATAEAIKKLQEEWKAGGPAPRDVADAIWKRFRGACDHFFERRKAQFAQQDSTRDANLKLLHGLCEKAEAMKESTQWISTAEAIKKLQAEWKATGPAPHKQGEVAWNRFRAACDYFFARRNAEFGKMDGERSENLTKKEAILTRLEATLAADPIPPGLERIDHWMGEWKAVGPAPREQADAVWERFRVACDRLRERANARGGGGRDAGGGDGPSGGRGRGPGGPGRGGPGRGAGGPGGASGRDRGPRRERGDGERGGQGERGGRGDRTPMVMSSTGPAFANKLPLQAIAARLKKALPAAAVAPVADVAASAPVASAPEQAPSPVVAAPQTDPTTPPTDTTTSE